MMTCEGDSLRYREIASALESVRARIHSAARSVGRSCEEITLLPVTKFHPLEDVRILHSLGITMVGENRDQEAREKQRNFPAMHFHMIGQIQRKKANSLARWASAVHSLDSCLVARALDHGMHVASDRGQRDAAGLPEIMPCYVQWNVDGNPTRGGASAQALHPLIECIESCSHLSFEGLMVVPPVGADAAAVFARGYEILMSLAAECGHSLKYSAGMSQDLDEAIKNGSTCVRVGTEILGVRS